MTITIAGRLEHSPHLPHPPTAHDQRRMPELSQPAGHTDCQMPLAARNISYERKEKHLSPSGNATRLPPQSRRYHTPRTQLQQQSRLCKPDSGPDQLSSAQHGGAGLWSVSSQPVSQFSNTHRRAGPANQATVAAAACCTYDKCL